MSDDEGEWEGGKGVEEEEKEEEDLSIDSSALDSSKSEGYSCGGEWDGDEDSSSDEGDEADAGVEEEGQGTGAQQEAGARGGGLGAKLPASTYRGDIACSRTPHVKESKRPSTYRGVYWHYGSWAACIREQGKQQHLGSFDTEEAAARAYDKKAKELQANPILNFLPDGSLNPDRKKRKKP